MWTPKLHESQMVRGLMGVLTNNVVEFVEVFCGLALLPRLTKMAIQYNVRDDINEMRWNLVPIGLVKPFEKDAKPWE